MIYRLWFYDTDGYRVKSGSTWTDEQEARHFLDEAAKRGVFRFPAMILPEPAPKEGRLS